MKNKQNILEICNWLWIWWTEKTLQIFCKYLDKSRYNIFACGIFKGWVREYLIKPFVSDILIVNWNINLIKEFVIKNNINIVHWHSITQSPWLEFEKSLELLEFFKKHNIKIIETSPFSLYNEKIDALLDIKLFVSKTSLIKYFWKFWKNIKYKAKYSFLYNPLDVEELEKYRLKKTEKIELRIIYWLNEHDFVIWKIGRADLWKWDDTIIDIVPKLIKKIPNLKIIIKAIPEIKKEKIKKMWLEKYFVFLSESVSEKDIADTYQLMDLMVHTSRIGESFGVSLVEWMFFWLPILTKSTDFTKYTLFDRDNSQTEIINNWENWYIENNINRIIDKIIELYKNKDLLEKISKNNISYSTNLFNSMRLVQRLEFFFENEYVEAVDYSLDEYKKKIKKETLYSLMCENIKAIIDKFIYKA